MFTGCNLHFTLLWRSAASMRLKHRSWMCACRQRVFLSSSQTRRTFGPSFMDGCFLAELLRQVIESFQPADLIEEPLFIALLCSLQFSPRVVNVLNEAKENTSELTLAKNREGET